MGLQGPRLLVKDVEVVEVNVLLSKTKKKIKVCQNRVRIKKKKEQSLALHVCPLVNHLCLKILLAECPTSRLQFCFCCIYFLNKQNKTKQKKKKK